MKFKDYGDLKKGLESLPRTWYPDLIRALVETSYRNGVWNPGGASRFISEVEKKQHGGTDNRIFYDDKTGNVFNGSG